LSDVQASDRSAAPADQVSLRRHNLAVVLRSLRDAGPRSRARIATDTGLSKATVSSLVAELADLELVRAGEVERVGGIGRPGQAVELHGRVCGLGAEVNVDYLAVLVLDMRGDQVLYSRIPFDVPTAGVQRTLDELAGSIEAAIVEARDQGHDVAGITVAVPGLVATGPGVLRYGPSIGWREVRVADELATRLARTEISASTRTRAVGRGPSAGGVTIRVDNNANLCALAEYVMGASAGTSDLVCLTGEIGVGAGVISDGRLLRGADGYGGEVGHMPIAEPLHLCACGRRGCWETAVGLAALLRDATDQGDPVTDPSVDLDVRLAEIRRRAQLGDGRTLRGLEAIATSLGLGAAILVNVFNPRVVVLGGYFAVLGDFLLGAMDSELDKRVVAPGRDGCSVELSTLGFTAAVRGGAHVAVEAVLADPTAVVRTAVPVDVRGGTP
jgi:predicted NBD/HSP70 family sugar kinase